MSLNRKTILSVILLTIATSAFAAHLVPATSSGFAYTGRTSHTYKPGAVAWTYPGVQIRCTFSGTSVQMKTNPDCGYFMVEIDSMAPHKVQVMKGSNTTLLGKDLPEGEHSLTLTYLIEGHAKKPTFYGLLLDDGCDLGERPVLPERRIEFIGNSITCGYGIEGDGTEKTFLFSKQNFYYTYAAIAARNLGAQYQVCARSGIGIYRNYAGKIPDQIMPNIYPHTFYTTNGELWDFSRFQPDVVCVNLGCNDTSVGEYDKARLTEAFKSFTKMLRGHYPKAKIVYLIGAIPRSKRLTDINDAQDAAIADAASRGDREVYRMNFTPEDKSLGMGSQGHPSMRRQALMGEELTTYLRNLMGW